MNPQPLKSKFDGIKSKITLIVVACVLLISIPFGWLFSVRFDSEAPFLETDLQYPALGASQTLPVSVSDFKSGLKEVWIGIIKDDKKIVLVDKRYKPEGFEGLIRGGVTHEDSFNVLIEPAKLGLKDGKATLRMVAKDFSWRRWLLGNKTVFSQDVMIDTKPPKIELLTKDHNIGQGGTGLAIYRLSEECPVTGVYVGNNLFPGYSGYYKDKGIYVAFFSVNFDQAPGTPIVVHAADFAGNTTRVVLPHHIRKRMFKKDVIQISDKFLEEKVKEFTKDISINPKASLIDNFLEINRKLRQANDRKIAELTEKSDNVMYWENFFLRLPSSAPKASFGDHREYKYNNQSVDRQIHMGVDLASFENAPVPASNTGKVVFAGELGIYGKTVLLDHGFGIFTGYSHLSNIEVQIGKKISKGETLGRTGSTGLAGGDHLHFSMIVHHTFVNPMEWWDGTWIKINILNKLESVK